MRPTIYADDTTLVTNISNFRAKSKEELNIKINNEIQKIDDWLLVNKLSLNVSKTKGMIFHTPNKQVQYPEIKIN